MTTQETHRELLVLAAKAAELKNMEWVYIGFQEQRVHGVPQCGTEGPIWNPLTNDGDALRLAVVLMDFEPYKSNGYLPLIYPDLEATRRAIVRAAAEIGKAMK